MAVASAPSSSVQLSNQLQALNSGIRLWDKLDIFERCFPKIIMGGYKSEDDDSFDVYPCVNPHLLADGNNAEAVQQVLAFVERERGFAIQNLRGFDFNQLEPRLDLRGKDFCLIQVSEVRLKLSAVDINNTYGYTTGDIAKQFSLGFLDVLVMLLVDKTLLSNYYNKENVRGIVCAGTKIMQNDQYHSPVVLIDETGKLSIDLVLITDRFESYGVVTGSVIA
jgi:hypothetical protein